MPVEPQMAILGAPGYCYALGYGLSAVLYIACNPKRLRGVRLWGAQVVLLTAAVGFSYATDTHLPIYFVPSLAAVLLLVFFMISLCCRMPVSNVAYFTLRSFVLGECFVSLDWLIYYYCAQTVSAVSNGPLGVALFFALLAALFIIMLLLERRFVEANQNLHINMKSQLQAFLIACGIYLLSNISNVDQSTLLSSGLPEEIFRIRALVDLGGVIMFYAYHMQMQEVGHRLEIEMLRQLMEAQYANYQMDKQSVALVQQKYHDLKHQIAYLRADLTSGEKLAYLDQMEEELKSFEVQNDTGNRVLDTILSAKQLQCQSQHISMHCVADGSCLGFMDVMDLSALFGNTLDNAIESAAQVPQDSRLIEVSVGQRKGFIVIMVGNSCAVLPEFEKGLPKTSKGDTRYHGFGTRSIQDTAKKYGGRALFSAEDGWFELKVVLPSA